MAEWQIERWDRSLDRAGFDSGKKPLDDFFRTFVGQYERRNIGRTYIAGRANDRRVLGYYTLAPGSVEFRIVPAALSKGLPRHSVPTILLARPAVDRSLQGRGLGRALRTDALARRVEMAGRIGVHAVEVDAVDHEASAFYSKYGFVPLLDDPLHLFLPIASIGQGMIES